MYGLEFWRNPPPSAFFLQEFKSFIISSIGWKTSTLLVGKSRRQRNSLIIFFIISIRIPPIKYMSYLYLLVHQSNLQFFHLEDIFHRVYGFSKGLRQAAAGSCSGSWLGASPFLLFVFRLRSLRRNLRMVILLSCLFFKRERALAHASTDHQYFCLVWFWILSQSDV